RRLGRGLAELQNVLAGVGRVDLELPDRPLLHGLYPRAGGKSPIGRLVQVMHSDLDLPAPCEVDPRAVLQALDLRLAVVRDRTLRLIDEGVELLVERDAVRLEGVVQVADQGRDRDFGLGDGRRAGALNEDSR